MDKEIALLNQILYHISNMIYKKIDGDMGFMMKISDNPQFLKNKIPEIHDKIIHYMDLMTTAHHINQLYMLKDYGEIPTYLESLVPSLEFYNKFFMQLSRKSKETEVKNFSDIHAEIMKLIRITKKKMKEKATEKKPKKSAAKKGGRQHMDYKNYYINGSYDRKINGSYDYYGGKITSENITIGGDVYTAGYMVEYYIADLEEKIKNSDPDDDDLVNYINKKIFGDKLDDVLSNDITYKKLANILSLDHLYNTIKEKYNNTINKVNEYIEHRRKQYLDNIEEKIEVIGGGIIELDDICDKIDEQDCKIIDNLIAKHIKDLNRIRDYEGVMDEYKNVEKICDEGSHNNRVELKKKIHESYNTIDNIEASSMVHTKVNMLADKKNLPKLLLDLLIQEKDNFISMEKEFSEIAECMGNIVSNLELLIGPDTSYCIMHTYNRYKAYISLQVLPIIEDRRFKRHYDGYNSLTSRLLSKVFPNVEFMDIYNNGFLWDNIEKNIHKLI